MMRWTGPHPMRNEDFGIAIWRAYEGEHDEPVAYVEGGVLGDMGERYVARMWPTGRLIGVAVKVAEAQGLVEGWADSGGDR